MEFSLFCQVKYPTNISNRVLFSIYNINIKILLIIFDQKKRKILLIILIQICLGVAVGCGWQAFVAYVNIGCYYVVGIPIGFVLGFTYDMGAKVK